MVQLHQVAQPTSMGEAFYRALITQQWRITITEICLKDIRELLIVRLLVRVYDCIRDPVIDAVFEDVDFGAMNAAFFTKICDIAVVVAMILLAVIVHVHQSWNHRKIGTR